eukprot:g5308.t1
MFHRVCSSFARVTSHYPRVVPFSSSPGLPRVVNKGFLLAGGVAATTATAFLLTSNFEQNVLNAESSSLPPESDNKGDLNRRDTNHRYSIYEKSEVKIFTGNAHPVLAKKIADQLGKKLSDCTVSKFRNGETNVKIHQSVRDCDVFVIQPTSNPTPNDFIMELVIMLDALRRAGAARVTAIIPIFGYARQDRKDKSRAPISAKVVSDILGSAGVTRVLTVDLHAPQIQGFVNFPIDNLYGESLLKDYITENFIEDEAKNGSIDNVVIVSPDAGGAKRADAMAKDLGEVEKMTLVGDVKDKTCIIVDDMVDTAGTVCAGAEALKAHGAKQVYAAVVHGVLSDPAIERINKSSIDEFVVTDTVPMEENVKRCKKLTVLSVAPMLAEAVRCIHHGGSLSHLFEAKKAPGVAGNDGLLVEHQAENSTVGKRRRRSSENK